GRKDGYGRTAGNHRLQALSIGNAPTIFIGKDKLFDGHAQLDFIDARSIEVAASRNQFGTRTTSHTDFRVFLAAVVDDGHGGRNGFDVIHYGGAIIEARYGRERRLDPGIAPFTLR